MFHPLDGHGFRHTFIFKQEDLTPKLKKALEDYFASYRKQIDEYEKMDATYASNFFYYEDVLMVDEIEDGSTHIAPSLIVVFYGADWSNFIEDLLTFQELFPASKLPRQNDYTYVLRDERKVFDDFKEWK